MKTNMSSFEKFQRILITLLVGFICFYGGYYMGKRGYLFEVRKNPPKISIINQYPNDKTVNFQLFWDVWNMINSSYLERPVDAQKMVYGAISGMVASLGDPYTTFLPPDTNKSLSDTLNGKYEGIGAELGVTDGQLVVIAPLDGSPAKAAGLKAGDKILKIDNVSTVGIQLTDAVAKIRGTSDTPVTLTVQTGNDQPRDVPLQRGIITVASVTWKDEGNGIAYIRISRFGEDTNDEWTKAVNEINVQMKQLDTVVVDVRGNPGGYLDSAVYIASEFFKDKPVVWEESPTGQQTPLNANRVGTFTQVPNVYVLIDGGSASASEILAAALKENDHATLVGVKSFGKGTIQDARDFSDGSGVHITIAKWLTPNKEWIHKIGLQPDVKVDISDADINSGKDPQLDKVLELAKQD
jgi:carboxyl-terminal processing protease